jgi:hypothetical protein
LPPRSACGAIILPGEINQAPKYITKSETGTDLARHSSENTL